MSDAQRDLLFSHRYTPRHVAAIAQVKTVNVRHWCVGYSRSGTQYPAVLRFPSTADSEPLRLSFLEMSEAFVIAGLRKRGIPLQRIRNAREFVKEHLQCDHPFAEKQFQLLGGRIIHQFEQQYPDSESDAIAVDGGGSRAEPNWVLPDFAQYAVSLFDYGDGPKPQWTERLYPRGRDVKLVADPQVRGGRVTVVGTTLTTDVIAKRSKSGESDELIAEDYGIPTEDVRAAIEFARAA